MTAVTTAPPAFALPAAESLAGVCGRARSELAALGELGAPLLSVVAVVERVGGARGVDVLDDPGFVLEVLTAAPEADASVVGRVLDFLRVRSASGGASAAGAPARERVTLATAVERYEAGPLAVMASGTQTGYRPWVRRLAAEHPDSDPAAITAGDLRDLITKWQLKIQEEQEQTDRRRQGGRGSARTGVHALRHLWAYLVEKKWATANVAAEIRVPAPPEARRRPWRPEEAALVRQLARSFGHDGLLNEVIICLAERVGLRRAEMYALRMCDVDLDRRVLSVWGKGSKLRDAAIPPLLAGLLERYIEDRRPADIAPDVWRRSKEYLLRSRPSSRLPHGRRAGRKRVDRLFRWLREEAAPELFVGWDQVFHCYRHSLGTWVERRYGRKATRAVLGHRGRQQSTDYYVHVPLEEQAIILAEYEQEMLAADPTYQQAA